jgi:hypothetical protein
MPSTLALPIEVRIERLGVADLDWRVGTNGGTIRGSRSAMRAAPTVTAYPL